ncbi:PREDICTED: nuclear receptor coactivator 5 [Thamnophis sirtalis]|uniref:Nuclear receptor coactivator 5 n=1 Tax=Thamnophis sirtalis TaxID=35019 RepID=A0A6I9Z1V5_9SAUR|nr:PREDICTED: nuclear receptor coactivator 5 [Thamnophis sirtalis]XP_013930011.1 PREDICTED: nuclear receptor coactivator 5 [Thamnophis sirtalis]
MNKPPSRSSPSRRAFPAPSGREPIPFGERDVRRDRSPNRGSPRRDGRNGRDSRDGRDLRTRELRGGRDHRDPRDVRDSREPLYDRFREAREPQYRREEGYDRYNRLDDYGRRREEPSYERYGDSMDRPTLSTEERMKREERRREELYRQFFEDIKKCIDAERPVDCSVIVVNKQTKDYAESVGRKVRDLGMMVDLIFLNSEMSLQQALDDVSQGGSAFAIVITPQHQVHHSCTVNIMFGTPQEHRNMPQADAMVLVAKNYERYKSEVREKEREEIARRAAKMADETILQERERPLPAEDGLRGAHPPAMQALLNLLADNRYLTGEETDKIINYLRERKERQLRATAEPLPASLPRQTMGASSGSLGSASQGHQSNQPLPASAAAAGPSTPQQELQAKILSLFNSGAAASSVNVAAGGGSGVGGSPNPGFASGPSASGRAPQLGVAGGPQSQQRAPSQAAQFSNHPGSSRVSGPRPSAPPQPSQPLYQSRPPAPSNAATSRPAPSLGINFDNPSVQKALDTLIQSGPALSHLVNQTVGQARAVPPAQQAVGSYQRHY